MVQESMFQDSLIVMTRIRDGMLEDQAIEGHDREHWVIRVDPNSVLDRHLGSQALQVDRHWRGVHFRTAPGRVGRKDPVARS